MPLKFRFSRWWLAVLLAGAFLLAWIFLSVGPQEPVFQGRGLGSWLRGQPNEYYPAVLAVGTNALPYLLVEIQAVDSKPAQFAEQLLAKVSMGPLWRMAQNRRYHAGLGLQMLDTNAVPALMSMIFSRPMQMAEGDPGWSAASALRFMGSEAAQKQIADRLEVGLSSPDTSECRNACLALSVWPIRRDDLAADLVSLSRDTNAKVRAAALRAIIFSEWREDLFLPVFVSRLEDEQAAVRRLAIEGLTIQRSNAVVALPALHAAYSNELTQSNQRGDLGDGYYGAHSWTGREIREAIRVTITAIDPKAPLPAGPP